MAFGAWVWLAFTGLIGVLVAVFVLEISGAVLSSFRRLAWAFDREGRPRALVLVPAHNESANILATIGDIKAQLVAGDSVLVVADNCTDDTALIAATAGASVIEREDLGRIGKGYALDCGLRHIARDPPEVVIIIDADCRLADGAIDHLAKASASTGRPTQALYLMLAPEHSSLNYQVAEFAWRVKNWVRPLGLSALKQPCQLVGTGMAIPWKAIRSVDLASGHFVEDLKLGLDLATAGYPPMFCPSAIVTSAFPSSMRGATTQRQRWEQGHIGLILTTVPRLILSAIVRGDLRLLAMALDLAVPPLSLLVLLLLAELSVSGFLALAGFSPLAFQISALTAGAFTMAIVLAWWKYGREILPARSLLLIGPYVLEKFRLYSSLLRGKQVTRWVRTDRD